MRSETSRALHFATAIIDVHQTIPSLNLQEGASIHSKPLTIMCSHYSRFRTPHWRTDVGSSMPRITFENYFDVKRPSSFAGEA